MTPEPAELYAGVLSLIKARDIGNPIKGKELAERFGYKDDRKIRLVIRQLIADGHPIAGSVEQPFGYYYCQTWQEAETYANQIKGRLIEEALRRRDFRRAAYDKLAGQIKMTLETK